MCEYIRMCALSVSILAGMITHYLYTCLVIRLMAAPLDSSLMVETWHS